MSEVKINELIDIEKIKPEEFFTATGFEITLARITADVRSVVVDIKTERGRKDLASLAHKIARSKTAIDERGKEFVSVLKEKSKVVDEARKIIRDQLDALKEEIRRPLTEIEEAEKKRIEQQKNKLKSIKGVLYCAWGDPIIILDQIKILENMNESDFDEQFKQEFLSSKKEAIELLNRRHGEIIEAAAKEVEIARLKKEAAERATIEREKRIAEEAAHRAANTERELARQALEKAEREKLEAEFKLKETERQKQKEIEEIKAKQIADEKKRIDEEKQKQRIEEERAANLKHQGAVNSNAKKALIEQCGLDESIAKNILIAIIKNKIPNVTIKY